MRIVDMVTFSTNHTLNSKKHKHDLNSLMSRQGVVTNVTQRHLIYLQHIVFAQILCNLMQFKNIKKSIMLYYVLDV